MMNVNDKKDGRRFKFEIIHSMFKSYDIESGLFRWRESLHYFKRGEMMRYVREA